MDEVVIYYMHPCPRQCVEWLHDKHIRPLVKETENLLSLVIGYTMLELDPKLQKPQFTNNPFLMWLLSSLDHVTWLKDYYVELCRRFDEVTQGEYPLYRLINVLKPVYSLLPRNGWIDPPCFVPADCVADKVTESYRLFYGRCKALPGGYRRVRKPYWLDQTRA